MSTQRVALVVALLAMLSACQSSEKVLPVSAASALVNGSIQIDSTPNSGTTLHARVPFNAERAA